MTSALPAQFRAKGASPNQPAILRRNEVSAGGADWILVALPSVLAIKSQYSPASASMRPLIIAAFLFGLVLLAFVAYVRPVATRFETRLGPLMMFLAASGIVAMRPDGIQHSVTFILVGLLAVRVVQTVDARRIIASLIDGIGLLCFANIFVYFVLGLRSPSEALRMNLNPENAARIYFPLSQSVNLTPTLAACFLASLYFVFAEPGWFRRTLRLLFAASAIVILLESGTRSALAVCILLVATVVLAPRLMRLIPIALVPLLFLSPVILRPVIGLFSAFISFFLARISDRAVRTDQVVSLAGRGFIWDQSMDYWTSSVNSLLDILLGYGMRGHYRSGASHTYAGFMSHVYRDTERAMHTHNSSLQQLFDAGLVGWIMLAVALFWCGRRLAARVSQWGQYALAASTILAAILMGAMTEVFLTPDMNLYTFFVTMVIVAVSCQIPQPDGDSAQPSADRLAAGRRIG